MSADGADPARAERPLPNPAAPSPAGPPIGPVAILGPGLIGGSVGLALRERFPQVEIHAWGRRESSLDDVRSRGFAQLVSADLAAVASRARLVVLCTPVETMADLAARLAPLLPADAVVTDAGSVKTGVVADCTAALGARFVGAHPIAGSERNGIDAARADLYAGATCVITPAATSSPTAVAATHALWEAVGCRTVEMSPAAHDAALARTSHLPHTVAAALAAAIARTTPDWPPLAGGGYRDTTRVALGDAALWTGILLANRVEVSTSIAELVQILQDFRVALERGDAEALRALLAEGCSARRQFDVL